MNIKPTTVSLLLILLFAVSNLTIAQTAKIYTIKANELKAEIQPTMWGCFL